MPDFNLRTPVFNKNVVQVYTEESGFTGYKGFDFRAIDEVESILKTDISNKTTAIVNFLSGIANGSVNVNQWNLSALDDSVTVSGDLRDTTIQIKNILSGIADGSINVNQWNLNAADDSVSVGGPLLNYVSGIAVNGVNVNQIDLDWQADSVSVGGPLLNYVSGIAVNGVNVNQIDLDWQADSVSVSGDLADIMKAVLVTGNNLPSGFNVYQANLDKNLDSVSTSPVQSSIISNSTVSGSNGIILNANQNRLELYIQNLSTGILYVKYGTNASSSSFNFVLAANTASNAGDGGSLSDQAYTGIVSVSGITPNYISWERS